MIINYIKDEKCIKYKYTKHLPTILVITLISNIALILAQAIEVDIIKNLCKIDVEATDTSFSFIGYYVFWIILFVHLNSKHKYYKKLTFSKNKTYIEQKSFDAEQEQLRMLKYELSKIPVAKVKQWYADGKLTDEQYKITVKKYNSLCAKIKEIETKLSLSKGSINE